MSETDVMKVIQQMTGNSDVLTKKYFDQFAIEMRIVDFDLASTEMNFLGHTLPMPLMLGVIGRYQSLGENAFLKSAEAAKELDTVLYVSSHQSAEELRKLTSMGVKTIQIVKPYLDEEHWIQALQDAEKAGCIAVGTDIDHAYKNGEYDGQRETFGPKSTEQLRRAVSSLSIPFIAKGVLSVHDAVKCKEAGVSAVILSHHHNIMNNAVPPLMILPEVRKAVGEDYCVLVDCGINTGNEAFKALAFGADGCCIARPFMVPLAKNGKEGVVEYFRKTNSELREYMNRTGSPDIKHIDPTVLHKLPF